MYDVLIVGAGISAATICACLKQNLKICVMEARDHLGGNCHDYADRGSHVHRYGPHIFHSKSAAVVELLSRYTQWTPFEHSVEAEIEHGGRLMTVPFPYSKLTERALGAALSEEQVIEKFFKGYSKKMWDLDWDRLPQSIRGRVPKDTHDRPQYFPGQFVAMPKLGFTHMMENMLGGVDLLLSADPDGWQEIPAHRVIYTGRPDLLRIPGEKTSFAERDDLSLPHRTLKIEFTEEAWGSESPIINYCSLARQYHRKTSYSRLTGGDSRIVSTEFAYPSGDEELAPFYPIPSNENHARYECLMRVVRKSYPELLFCGRLGTYKYLDMYQAVGQALALVHHEFPGSGASIPADAGQRCESANKTRWSFSQALCSLW